MQQHLRPTQFCKGNAGHSGPSPTIAGSPARPQGGARDAAAKGLRLPRRPGRLVGGIPAAGLPARSLRPSPHQLPRRSPEPLLSFSSKTTAGKRKRKPAEAGPSPRGAERAGSQRGLGPGCGVRFGVGAPLRNEAPSCPPAPDPGYQARQPEGRRHPGRGVRGMCQVFVLLRGSSWINGAESKISRLTPARIGGFCPLSHLGPYSVDKMKAL